MDADHAETIALQALGFLADDPERLGRFLGLTGMGPAELSEKAQTPQVLLAVLEHLLQDEGLLLVFAASSGTPPEDIAPAHAKIEQMAGITPVYD